MKENLERKINDFEEAEYPREGKKLSIIECLRTITKDKGLEFDPKQSTTIKIGDRSFELIDLYCPDLKVPNANLWDQSARIYLSRKEYIIEYFFDNASDDISSVHMYKEDPKGIFEICGRKVRELASFYRGKYKKRGEISPDR